MEDQSCMQTGHMKLPLGMGEEQKEIFEIENHTLIH